LVVISILLLVSLSVSRIIAKEMFFSKLVELSKVTYFAADSGIECAKYLDSNFRDLTLGVSLILNSTSTGNGNADFITNSNQNIFFASSTVRTSTGMTGPTEIYCNNNDNTYNRIFYTYALTPQAVEDNLKDETSSFNIIGDDMNATTTFGLILKSTDPNTGDDNVRCALVVFSKQRTSVATDTTAYFEIISTGYSSCDPDNRARASRTVFESSS
ncbi:MAG: hypothetical protein QG630_472, partial [Patescibacteria group bacterium]|nr:hypothetical protein [Patescibacteria group bacterium]